jgi:hypothetical protein
VRVLIGHVMSYSRTWGNEMTESLVWMWENTENGTTHFVVLNIRFSFKLKEAGENVGGAFEALCPPGSQLGIGTSRTWVEPATVRTIQI